MARAFHPGYVVVPMAIVLAGGGVALMTYVSNSAKVVPGYSFGQPRHPVTEAMLEEAKRESKKIAPFFKLPDTDGKQVVIGGKGEKPLFVYFVKEGCPCSFDAEPMFQRLFKHHEGRIEFISVTDAKGKAAEKWDFDLLVPYPLVSNPTFELMKAYSAPASVYCTLIGKDGTIVKQWPGYSRSMMKEMNALMAKAAGAEEKPFDTAYAPEAKTSGCSFEME